MVFYMHIAEIIQLSIMSEWLQWRNKEKGHTTSEGEKGKTPSAGTEGGSGRYINRQRRSKYHELTDTEIASLKNDIREIESDG